jgi:SAM-dependent methyltransferase
MDQTIERHETVRDPGTRRATALTYPSMPYAFTQPGRLAALAALFGLPARPADEARVLELGCAGGGNILPLAARYPKARFVGIDLSHAHIDEGRQRVRTLGLTNVDLRQGDIAHLALGAERFDYIICHGVYSWVRPNVREAVLRLCAQVLAPDGVAMVSYNVLPGWHLRQVARDACRRYTGSADDPVARAARAREVLQLLAQSANERAPYGKVLHDEAQRAPLRPASYIVSELLEEPHAPCYFEEFAERALANGLAFLCEADLAASTPELFNDGVAQRLEALAGGSPLEFEQALDYLSGRSFRRSLLVHARHGSALSQEASRARLEGLYFTAGFRPDARDPSAFIDRRGRTISVAEPAMVPVLSALAQSHPRALSHRELSDIATRDAAQDAARAQEHLCKTLMLMLNAGQVEASTLPLVAGTLDARCPRAWWYARAECAQGQPWVTTLSHDAATLHPVMAFLMPRLDGHHDRERLTACMQEAVTVGLLALPDAGPQAARDAEHWLDAALRYMQSHALLEEPCE